MGQDRQCWGTHGGDGSLADTVGLLPYTSLSSSSSVPVALLDSPVKPSNTSNGWSWLGRQRGPIRVTVGAIWWDRAWDRHRGVKGPLPLHPLLGLALPVPPVLNQLENWLEEEVSHRAAAMSWKIWVSAGPVRTPRLWPREQQAGAGGVFGQTVGDHPGVTPALKSHEASPDAVPIQPSPLLGPSGRAGISPASHNGKMLVLCLSPLVRCCGCSQDSLQGAWGWGQGRTRQVREDAPGFEGDMD